MRLAISNIAWDISEDEEIAILLQRNCVDAIDIAPGKYFPLPERVTSAELHQVKAWWAARGIEITGMQALLFGTSDLNVFGTSSVQASLLKHLDAVCRIGGELSARRLVFGSPKNRDRSGLNDVEAMAAAVSFFRRLGDVAASHGVFICLEPNPPCYGANFMTTSDETAQIVSHTNHSAIRMQFDTGTLTINGENPVAVLQEHAALIEHIHVSEPNLLPLGDGGTDHARMSEALIYSLPNHMATIEMVATHNEPHLVSVQRALGVAISHYRRKAEGLIA
jgi:D-psicose/D-tagatose/L-ribulose 3-epimerase